MSYILGVDGGNTKTIALVARIDGTIVGAGRAQSSDIYMSPSIEFAFSQLQSAVNAALRDTHVSAQSLVAGAFSLAGADWPEDIAFLQATVNRFGFGQRTVVVNDAIGALRAGSPDGTGVVIACGTGAACGARAADGRIWHTSFWQGVSGADELGRNALHAIYRAELKLGPPTALTQPTLQFLRQDSVEGVLRLFTMRGAEKPSWIEVAKLARIVLDEAARGDAVAMKIVGEHGEGLADYCIAAARQVGIERTSFYLVLTGGVFRHPSNLTRDTIVRRVHQFNPDVRPVMSRYEPAVGALIMGLELAGVELNDEVRGNIEASLPSHDLFTT
jgi:N-acetylglucosamine kinase-like BadF-type ATPase